MIKGGRERKGGIVDEEEDVGKGLGKIGREREEVWMRRKMWLRD